MPLVPVLSRVERNGVKIDPAVLHKHSEEITLRLAELEKKAHDIAGEAFNLSSTKQLQTILFEKQGIKPLKKRLAARRQRRKRCWKSWRWTIRCRK
ncbi:DNA polymerase I [Salmonella enterica subsp. enterica]|uniref:DNA-directed DNA polymerase n=1 Tax=Salmonella enterica I TaxID=59201 RepID=A0A379X461_SALET|nr:DNA polymerase I [Salmonella enterica subsp. enterica]